MSSWLNQLIYHKELSTITERHSTKKKVSSALSNDKQQNRICVNESLSIYLLNIFARLRQPLEADYQTFSQWHSRGSKNQIYWFTLVQMFLFALASSVDLSSQDFKSSSDIFLRNEAWNLKNRLECSLILIGGKQKLVQIEIWWGVD